MNSVKRVVTRVIGKPHRYEDHYTVTVECTADGNPSRAVIRRKTRSDALEVKPGFSWLSEV